MPRMITIAEASAETGVSYSCIRKWILEGQFTGFVKAGNKYLINKDLFAAFLNGGARGETR